MFRAIWQMLFGKRKPDPSKQLQEIIKTQTEKLQLGREVIERHAGLIRDLSAKQAEIQKDINIAEAKAEEAVAKSNDEEARRWLATVQTKTQQIAEIKKKLETAHEQHNKCVDQVKGFNDAIQKAEDQIRELKTQRDMSQINRDRAEFEAGLNDTVDVNGQIDSLKQEIAQNEAQATAADMLNEDPNKEYLDAAEGTSDAVENRLAAMKAKVSDKED